jgi:hypothetical protein
MRSFLLVLAVLCSVRVHARAEPVPVPEPVAAAASAPAAETPSSRFALAVNAPLGWTIHSFAASAYVRLDEHWAVRGNLASYRNGAPLGAAIGDLRGDGGTGYGGTIFDVGIAVVWYPRRMWDGFLFEAGAFRRDRDVYVWPEFENKTFTRSTEYAGRVLFGWSWLIRERAFIAIAAGLSAGPESGNSTYTPDTPDRMPTTTQRVQRMRSEGEGYIRIGVVFGE